jgi:hypothetical protein
MDSLGLKKFPRGPSTPITDWRLGNNPFTTFEGMTVIPTLQVLRCERTSLNSFKGAVAQPALESLDLSDTPLSRYELHVFMAVIVFGDQLKTVNGQRVLRPVQQRAAEHRPRLFPLLTDGWIVTSLQRLMVLYNPVSHTRQQIYQSDPSNFIGKVIAAQRASQLSGGFDEPQPPPESDRQPPDTTDGEAALLELPQEPELSDGGYSAGLNEDADDRNVEGRCSSV